MAAKSVSLIPTKGQNFFEMVVTGIEEFMVDITGEEGRWLFPMIATVFIYIFTCNLIGLVPGFFPPTASLNTTLSCALTVVIFTHVIGIKYHGAKYIKHFIGPVWWMIPIIFPIEVIGHTARILSLSFRLFGNMMGHELVLSILFALAGLFFRAVAHHGPGDLRRAGSGVCFFSAVDHVFHRGHGTCPLTPGTRGGRRRRCVLHRFRGYRVPGFISAEKKEAEELINKEV